jgi:hypothetical protein
MIQERFWGLCSEAEESYAAPDLEPALVEVLRLAKSCPEARPELARCFIDLVRHPERGPWEVVQFCMHSLRWSEVRAAVEEDFERAKADQDWRAIPVLSHILAAFDPAWDDADLYRAYRRNGGDPTRENS